MSGVPVDPVYGPADAERPGRYPYTRGPYTDMYRSKLWTMRIFAMCIANAEDEGVERARLGGTLQNDILKEYQAQKEFIFPPRSSLRIVRDTIAFCTEEMPRWHPISISGYHIREAGSTAAQEL